MRANNYSSVYIVKLQNNLRVLQMGSSLLNMCFLRIPGGPSICIFLHIQGPLYMFFLHIPGGPSTCVFSSHTRGPPQYVFFFAYQGAPSICVFLCIPGGAINMCFSPHTRGPSIYFFLRNCIKWSICHFGAHT